MKLVFAEKAWDDYLYWQKTDRKTLKRINTLIKDIQRNPFEGIGDPEPLKYNWAGFWSRRITKEHRIIYPLSASTHAYRLRRRWDVSDILCSLQKSGIV